MSRYPVSIIMPSLNEEANLRTAVENVVENFTAFGIEGQLVIINDGSTDKTGQIAEEFSAKYPFIKVIHHSTPQGIGGSFWDGVKAAEGESVTMVPGDGENDSAEILRYLPLMKHVDIVVPFVYNKGVRTGLRRLLSKLYRGIINLTFGLTLNYMNGTVLYRKSAFNGIELKAKGFFYQTELLIKCISRGYLYAEVPSALNVRAVGESKATTFKSLKKVIRAYFETYMEINSGGHAAGGISPDTVTARRWTELDK